MAEMCFARSRRATIISYGPYRSIFQFLVQAQKNKKSSVSKKETKHRGTTLIGDYNSKINPPLNCLYRRHTTSMFAKCNFYEVTPQLFSK